MDTEKGQYLKDTSYKREQRVGCDFTNASETEKSILTNSTHPPENTMSSSHESSSKPALSYIALIAKVILSSPSQKLNLASIYRAMEEQFPHLRNRGPGWRNSVRHNLSVNECFVKVSRCEDGRGHHWGVHQNHLRDFQKGNFKQHRKTRGRSESEKKRYDKETGYLTWIERSYFWRKLCESESLSWVEPRCPLQEPRSYQMSGLDLNWPWSVYVGCRVQPPSWMRHYWQSYSYGGLTAARVHNTQPLTWKLHAWGATDPEIKHTKES